MRIPRETFGKMAVALLAFFILSSVVLEKAEAENLIFRFIAVNPSATKTQDVQVKKYLPPTNTEKENPEGHESNNDSATETSDETENA